MPIESLSLSRSQGFYDYSTSSIGYLYIGHPSFGILSGHLSLLFTLWYDPGAEQRQPNLCLPNSCIMINSATKTFSFSLFAHSFLPSYFFLPANHPLHHPGIMRLFFRYEMSQRDAGRVGPVSTSDANSNYYFFQVSRSSSLVRESPKARLLASKERCSFNKQLPTITILAGVPNPSLSDSSN